MSFIQDYYDHKDFLDVILDHSQGFNIEKYDHILFSYHGLPQRQLLKADDHDHCLQKSDCCQTIGLHNRHCYAAQSYATSAALADRLNLSPAQYTTCFQSRLGRDPWTRPYTSEVLNLRAKNGDKNILVFSPAFVADCLETIVEVGYEYQKEFSKLGGHKLELVPSLNDDPKWIETILNIIEERTNFKRTQ